MASISTYITAIRNAIYGKDVRSSIADGLDAMNTQLNGLNKSSVGLGNVDNTSDANKPVSTAQATAISSGISTHNTAADSHSDIRTSINEKTDYGVLSGLGVAAQSTPNMTVNVPTGVVFTSSGVRFNPSTANLTAPTADNTLARTDIVYVNSNGVSTYLAGTVAKIAGSRTYTLTVAPQPFPSESASVITIVGVTLTGNTSAQDSTHFICANSTDLAGSVTNIVASLNANATVTNLYTVTANGTSFTITEKVAGGGNTPSVATVTGSGAITSGTATTSATTTSTPASLPVGGFLLAQISVPANATAITNDMIIDKRKMLISSGTTWKAVLERPTAYYLKDNDNDKIDYDYEIGRISETTGVNYIASTGVRTQNIVNPNKEKFAIVIRNDLSFAYRITPFTYKDDGSFYYVGSNITAAGTYSYTDGYKRRMCVIKTDGSNLTSSEAKEIIDNVYFISLETFQDTVNIDKALHRTSSYYLAKSNGIDFQFERGGINTSTGVTFDSPTGVRTVSYVNPNKEKYSIVIGSLSFAFIVLPLVYNDDGTFYGVYGSKTAAGIYSYTDGKKHKWRIYKSDGTTITPSQVQEIVDNVYFINNENADYIPDYYNTGSYLDTKIATINTHEKVIGYNGDSFAFITDVHKLTNAGHSHALLKKILPHTQTKKIIFGGDILDTHNDTTTAPSLLRGFLENYQWCDSLYLVRGNHDMNPYASSADYKLTKSQLYGLYFKGMEKLVNTSKDFKYYFDNASQKIRYIVIDTGDEAEPLTADIVPFLTSKITELESGWSVVVLMHLIYLTFTVSSGTVTAKTLDNISTAVLNQLQSLHGTVNADIVGVFGGHTHFDYADTSTYSFPIILTTCDNYGQERPGSTLTRTQGTTTEQAFDIVQIDTGNRKIYTTRIGAGSDREFSY